MKQPPPTLPAHIRRNIGPSWATIAITVAVVATMLLLRAPFDGSASEVLLHGPGLAYLAIPVLVALGMALLRHAGTLDIDEAGVAMASRQGRYFYAWADMMGAIATRRGVQVMMRGEDMAASRLNLIPAAFGIAPPALAALINEGRARWGGGERRGRSAGSITPSQNAAGIRRRQLWLTLGSVAAVYVVIAAFVIVSQAAESAQTSRLRQAGVRADAAVARIYAGTCSRSGCEARVDYVFRPASGAFASETVHGYATLAFNDWKDDPDYRSARSTGAVPIVYDPAQPTSSELNFRDAVFHRDVMADTLQILLILGGAMAFVMGLVAAVSLRSKAPRARPEGRPRHA